jgi:hypothetical protein
MKQVIEVEGKRGLGFYRLMVRVLLLSALLVLLLATLSYAGSLFKPTEAIQSQLGIRCLSPITQNLQSGALIKGIIEDDKLPRLFKFRNLKRGDNVELLLLNEGSRFISPNGGGKFQVKIGAQTQKFIIEDGKVKLLQ